ncbi:MAG: hypothetical protein EZS28_036990, partial [Streblomastix strix]
CFSPFFLVLKPLQIDSRQLTMACLFMMLIQNLLAVHGLNPVKISEIISIMALQKRLG